MNLISVFPWIKSVPRVALGLGFLVAALLWGCAHTVLVSVPPRMDLSAYPSIGIVSFSSNAKNVGPYATQQFEEYVQSGQAGVRVVEIPASEGERLGKPGAPDAEAVRALGRKYNVAAVFVGDVSYTTIQPTIKVNDLLNGDASAKANITGALTVRLVETGSGATAWTRSAAVRRTLAGISGSKEQPVLISGSSSLDPRSEMVPGLAEAVTGDFHPTTVRRRAE